MFPPTTIMRISCLLAALLLFLGRVEGRKAVAYHERRWKADAETANEAGCDQEHPNCQNCLLKSNCVWCVTDKSQAIDGECRKTEYCLNRQTTCDSPASDDQEDERAVAPNVAPQNQTKNASAVCVEADCDSCTKNDFCFWCQSTGSCDSYFNDTTVNETCPTGSWYKDQCIYPVGVTPCQARTNSCDDCLSDNMCYWCETTDECGLFPSEHYTPPHCPSDRVYQKDCPYAGSLLLVLLPILSIILIPVLIYICIWFACCCMRAAGYDPLEDDSDQDPPGERKHRKGIRLRPGSPSNRTDTLRKKYKLDNP